MSTLLLSLLLAVADEGFEYPVSRRSDQVDVYHGTTVADPYRWLEADVRESPEAAAWVAAQNKVTFAYLESIPQREPILRRLTEMWDHERYSPPVKIGGRYYFSKNNGLQNQSVLYVLDSLRDEPRVLIDPNTWSQDGTIALAGTAPSDDGRHIAYGVAEAGSDWNTWRVMEIESGEVLEDEIRWIKFSTPAWTKDGKGFFYSRFDEPEPGSEYQGLNLNQKLYYHRLGRPQSDDVLVYHRPDQPLWGYEPTVTEDGRYLVITVWKGTDDKYRILVKDLEEPYGMPVELVDEFRNEYTFVGNDGPVLYFMTDLDAPRRRLISIDVRAGNTEGCAEVIPQANETLEQVSYLGGMFVASYLKDAKTQVKVLARDGQLIREIDFPTIGSADGFGGRQEYRDTFYAFSSFATPPTIYHHDVLTGASRVLFRPKVDVEPDAYEVSQVFYRSKDGTRVPMFLAHKKGIELDGSNPTLLYGYGGFNISLTPSFSVSRLVWMEMGGVFAMPNLRGGGEYGQRWHEAGTLTRKQNVFDDFIAAAEWLIDNGYTSREKLAIEGRSNGGLLVGAVMTQRPDLFAACLPGVGVMDMLRFHKFSAGRYWVDDYGSADDPEVFPALLAYSPCHNAKEGVAYPATLITTADTDDRVVPGHSFKFAAAIQHAQAGPAPLLIRIETRAGHGAGKPTRMIIEEVADGWAFLVKSLNMKLP